MEGVFCDWPQLLTCGDAVNVKSHIYVYTVVLSSLTILKDLEPSPGKRCLSLLYGAAAWKSSWGPKKAKFACPTLYQRRREEGIIEAWGSTLQCVCGTRWVFFKLMLSALGMHKELYWTVLVLIPFSSTRNFCYCSYHLISGISFFVEKKLLGDCKTLFKNFLSCLFLARFPFCLTVDLGQAILLFQFAKEVGLKWFPRIHSPWLCSKLRHGLVQPQVCGSFTIFIYWEWFVLPKA